MAGGFRIGADVGGTFTDVVLERPDGTYTSTKVLTTSEAPDRGILDGLVQLASDEHLDLADVEQFIHGTTLATNALIERRGASTAFVTTDGFRDVIETRTESRFEQYDLNIVLPTPLIERKDRYTVAERRNARGEVLVPLDDDDVRALVSTIADRGYESVAIGFIHSYVDGSNERRVRELLLDALPDVSVSISSEVSPQIREYERFNTVCANAYVQPLMASYLMRLRDQLKARGVACPLYLVHSGGGLMSVESAAAFPVRLVESGPAGGAIFAADIAARYGRDRVLSFDMGGTTAKISLIDDYRPQTAKTFEVDRTARFKKGSGMPISIPVIDMIEIGAGGGSIASVDALDQIRIGPQSAGSEPGPAAYSLGGLDATVTDANLQLGRLHPDTFGAKDIDLSPALATAALMRSVGDRLGMDAGTAAVGVAEVVDENMANAARAHTVENGKDLGGYTMIAFGGGAPLHAARLLDKLGLDELIVPSGAGVGSAIGFLVRAVLVRGGTQLLHHDGSLRRGRLQRGARIAHRRGDVVRPAGHRRRCHDRTPGLDALRRAGLGDTCRARRTVGRGVGAIRRLRRRAAGCSVHQVVRRVLRSGHRRPRHRSSQLVGARVVDRAHQRVASN